MDIFVTGASNNHFKTLVNCIDSWLKFFSNTCNDNLVVFDYGLNEENVNFFKSKFENNNKIIFEKLDFSKYPDWMNIDNERGQYAFKALSLEIAVRKYNYVQFITWIDAGNIITNNLNSIKNFIIQHGSFSSTTNHTIEKWTHPGTIRYFKNLKYIFNLNETSLTGGYLAFNLHNLKGRQIFDDYIKFCKIKECIAPEGSSRENHRQDQSVYSILYTHYKIFKDENSWKQHKQLGFEFYNDVPGEGSSISNH